MCSVVTEVGGMEDGGEREIQEAGDVCIHIADTLCCTAETNNIVKQLYSNNTREKKERPTKTPWTLV